MLHLLLSYQRRRSDLVFSSLFHRIPSKELNMAAAVPMPTIQAAPPSPYNDQKTKHRREDTIDLRSMLRAIYNHKNHEFTITKGDWSKIARANSVRHHRLLTYQNQYRFTEIHKPQPTEIEIKRSRKEEKTWSKLEEKTFGVGEKRNRGREEGNLSVAPFPALSPRRSMASWTTWKTYRIWMRHASAQGVSMRRHRPWPGRSAKDVSRPGPG